MASSFPGAKRLKHEATIQHHILQSLRMHGAIRTVLCLINQKNILTLKERARKRNRQLLVSLCGAYERAGAGSYWGRLVEEDTPGAGRKVELRGGTSAMWSPSDYSTQPFQNRHKNSCRALRLCSSELTYLRVIPHVWFQTGKCNPATVFYLFIYLFQELQTRS
jgi:hypothetical protein